MPSSSLTSAACIVWAGRPENVCGQPATVEVWLTCTFGHTSGGFMCDQCHDWLSGPAVHGTCRECERDGRSVLVFMTQGQADGLTRRQRH